MTKKILGIDPGTTLVGYGVIEETAAGLKAITYGKLKIKSKTLNEKLKEVAAQTNLLIKKLKPDLVGLEKLFFSKNRKTALAVAQARGVIVSEIMSQGIPLIELTPAEVKIAVTSYGRADKEMVRKMVTKILDLNDFNEDDNVSDALAVAICAANQSKLPFWLIHNLVDTFGLVSIMTVIWKN